MKAELLEEDEDCGGLDEVNAGEEGDGEEDGEVEVKRVKVSDGGLRPDIIGCGWQELLSAL